MEEVDDFKQELARVFAASGNSDTPCPLGVVELQRLAVEYLHDYDAELIRFPERVGETHWNLWQWDEPGEFDRDSYFVVLVVCSSGLEFACGYGPQHAVREFADSDFPDEVERVIPELARRFTMPSGSVRVGRAVAESWAGRGLGVRADPGAAPDPPPTPGRTGEPGIRPRVNRGSCRPGRESPPSVQVAWLASKPAMLTYWWVHLCGRSNARPNGGSHQHMQDEGI